jgi:cytochrome c-type biogenesis protein CcmH/NrfF
MSRARCGGFAEAVARRVQPAAGRAASDRRRVLRAACLAACVALAASFGAAAAARAADEAGWGYALANELMSPWCPGFALPDCSSGYAADLRLWILEQERLGRSREEVKAEILARYGEKMLQAPRAEGRGIFAYAIPAALILGGLAVLVRFLRAQRVPARASDIEAGITALALDPLLLTRVDRELASYEASADANPEGASEGSTGFDAGGGSDSGESAGTGPGPGSDS